MVVVTIRSSLKLSFFPVLLECNMTGLRLQDMLSRCGHFVLVDLVRFNCAPIRGLNASAVFGVELTTEGLERYPLSRLLHVFADASFVIN